MKINVDSLVGHLVCPQLPSLTRIPEPRITNRKNNKQDRRDNRERRKKKKEERTMKKKETKDWYIRIISKWKKK